ncbi:hypothetical protein CWB73_00500 [Pseudoalteromonas phenolica]|uniref:Uncharacterized protein n=1 Tax=Pseudoalteromonas phenolica TaxID=161398 RepID=A0A5S3YYT9_9GAMM|nr:hypothetical protein [Pseudoalteromonas phenolica]TMP84180.1 hypothetical protein CWB73_00500 [Pseudoalteromonas phenolica]
MDIQILVNGAYQTVERNVDTATPADAIKQLCEEMQGTTDFQLVYTDAEIANMRQGAYQSEIDGKLLELLADKVLPAIKATLPEATQAEVTALLTERQEIKARYPKPTA